MGTTTTERTMICAVPHSGPHGFAVKGRKYDCDDPRVLAAPQFFADSGSPEELWPTEFDNALEQHAAAAAAREDERRLALRELAENNRVKIPAPRMVKATEDFVAIYAGRTSLIEKGSIVVEHDSLATGNPERWKAI